MTVTACVRKRKRGNFLHSISSMAMSFLVLALLFGLSAAGPRRGCDGLWRKIDHCRGNDVTIEKIMTKYDEVPAVRKSMQRCIAIMTAPRYRNRTDLDEHVCTSRSMYLDAADCLVDVVDDVKNLVEDLGNGDKRRVKRFKECALRVHPGPRYY
ncbi:uncharacterized protein LOC135400156 [Ornithodoros turicata]|uniref:uncharacterized protein LOC135400156 n=1 Tax=Ornithodoros turicata TaxID=34597 RepID=UPI0031386298